MPNNRSTRPTLTFFTVYFDDRERDLAWQLGERLYDSLTRPIDDPLAYGPAIPVYSGVSEEFIDFDAAEHVILIPVLGRESYKDYHLERVLKQINDWHEQLGDNHVLPVPHVAKWRQYEGRFKGKLLLTEIYPNEEWISQTVSEIVSSVAPVFDEPRGTLFISHAKADLKSTEDAAIIISEFANNKTTWPAFFDQIKLLSGNSLMDQLRESLKHGVFVAVRGDSYSSRIWCQHELLIAKENELPTLTVEMLTKGEHRSLAYGGNSASLVWDKNNPGDIISRAIVAWIAKQNFKSEGARICRLANLPKSRVVIRAPELLDLAQGPLRLGESQVVMHPDPELPSLEKSILRSANARIRFATPTTVYRRELGQLRGNPLDGIQVAMSLSDSPDENGSEGFTSEHVEDVVVHLCRTMISSGAAIAYGGDFRQLHERLTKEPKEVSNSSRRVARHAYTYLLAELVSAHNQSMIEVSQNLHSYLSSPLQLGEEFDSLPIITYHMDDDKENAFKHKLLDRKYDAALDQGLEMFFHSDMRQVMAKLTDARILIGGNTEPRIVPHKSGYGGVLPGVVEEAWRTHQQKKPLYVIGGFGGASELVATLLTEGQDIPTQLRDETWEPHEAFRKKQERFIKHPDRTTLNLPSSMEALAGEVQQFREAFFLTDKNDRCANGLTPAENRELFATRDRIRIVDLVMRGLLYVRRTPAGQPALELVHGSITDAEELELIAVAAFDDVPIGGAGAAIDRHLGHVLSLARESGEILTDVASNVEIDTDWIYVASLGSLSDPRPITERIQLAAESLANTIRRHGFESIGLVTFGGNVSGNLNEVIDAQWQALGVLPDETKLFWFEKESERYGMIKNRFAERDIRITTRRIDLSSETTKAVTEKAYLSVRWDDGKLVTEFLSPRSNAIIDRLTNLLNRDEFEQLSAGIGSKQILPPSMLELEERGAKLATLLFGHHGEFVSEILSDHHLVVVHDAITSRIPFELLRFESGRLPALEHGISRRLAAKNVSPRALIRRPPVQSSLQVLLIIDPRGDLPNATQEGLEVEKLLNSIPGINVDKRIHAEATCREVISLLKDCDVLHYCGHGYFEDSGESESGLVLHDGKLNLFHMRDVYDVPRVVFLNACQGGRVRTDDQAEVEADSFAEFFLRAGVESFLGTYWLVNDEPALNFAKTVYAELAIGNELITAVTRARDNLNKSHAQDWGNYVLYGPGDFRLVREKITK
ncbi:CHAT domain-containing protein [uncultured Rubinisphaera sp.]|uniref:CHAT domain-containing protein n=1 Tax=uncultured Rubinisphaera sp. TaxID=1678686 RepID=UPI0030DD7A7B